MRIRIIISIWLVLAVFSCETIETEKANPDVPVVECYIQPEVDVEVLLSKQLIFDSDDTVNHKLDNLEVFILANNENYLLDNLGNGFYTNPFIEIEENKEYELFFNYNENKVSAKTIVLEKPKGFSVSSTTIEIFTFDKFDQVSGGEFEMPEPIELNWLNPDANYHMVVAECIEENPILINESTDMPGKSFRNAPTQGTQQKIHPSTFKYYGQHRLILYILNSEYAALYEQLGSSSLDIVAPPSNIENGLGIFTGINSDTINVNVVAP